jgi:hypothetical protein
MLELELTAGFGKQARTLAESAGSFPRDLQSWHLFLEFEAKVLRRVLDPFPVFAGGVFKFELGGTTEGETELSFYLGGAGAVELEIPHFAKVKGTRTHTTVLQHIVGKKQVRLGTCAEWEVEASLLEVDVPGEDFGLISIALSFELLVVIDNPQDILDNERLYFNGKGTVAVDISLGWVFNKQFEYEIELTEEVAKDDFQPGSIVG